MRRLARAVPAVLASVVAVLTLTTTPALAHDGHQAEPKAAGHHAKHHAQKVLVTLTGVVSDTATATIGIRNCAPVVSVNAVTFITRMTPARPHSAPEMAQARSMTRSVAIPQLRARSGSAAVARIALPSLV